MIGVDLTFILDREIKEKRFVSSFSIFVADILDAFKQKGLQDKFCLIVFEWHEEYIRQRFSGFSVCPVKWKPSEWMCVLSKGKYRGRKFVRWFNTYKFSKCACIWFPYALPRHVMFYNRSTICTVHDLMIYHNEKGNIKRKKEFEKMISASSRIVAVSEHTRRDILESFDYDGSKAYVIPNSIHLQMSECERPSQIQRKFILDINGFGPHKNALTLLKAFALIADKIDVDLVCCGGWRDDNYWGILEGFVREQKLEERIHLYFAIPEAQRNWLLKNATLFVTPSTNEGFGRTPVEAAICGVSVISTKAASLYEVTKGLLHYYNDPYDEEELAERMLECITVPDSVEKREEVARILSKEYMPESCAMKYWQILKEFEVTSSKL